MDRPRALRDLSRFVYRLSYFPRRQTSHGLATRRCTNALLEEPLEKSAVNQKAKQTKWILIVDDHPLFRSGLAQFLNQQKDLEVCAHADSAPAALDKMRKHRPDLAIIDVSLQGTNGIELIKLMKAEQPKLPILTLSMHDETSYALRALKAGALGYLTKAETLEHVLHAVRRVLEGKICVSPRFGEKLIFRAINGPGSVSESPVDSLSDRELEVLTLLGKGQSTKLIAQNLNLSVKTVETHRAHIKEKLGFGDSNEMIRFAVDWVTHQGMA
jgi:DNA-binding NarL/FixJ family response regulator